MFETKQFIITKTFLDYNYNFCLNAIKFNTIICKFDQDNLSLIENLHDNRLRTKDIFLVLNLISLKYTHKSDVYNTISC